MTAHIEGLARIIAGALPLTLLCLGFVFVLIVAVLFPTEERREMVERLGTAIKDIGGVIAGPRTVRGQQPRRALPKGQ